MIYMIDIQECTLNTDNCHANAICTNTIGSFVCTCKDGFSGDGEQCTGKLMKNLYTWLRIDTKVKFLHIILSLDIDECTSGTSNCKANAHCINTIGSYKCVCDTGYIGHCEACEGT